MDNKIVENCIAYLLPVTLDVIYLCIFLEVCIYIYFMYFKTDIDIIV